MSDRNNQEKFKEILGMAAFKPEKKAVRPEKEIREPVEANVDDSHHQLDLPVYEELVELPSRGLCYKDSHPLYGKTHVEIKQVSGKEEKILTNKDYLKSGIALTSFVKSLLLDEELKKPVHFDEIVDADRTAIILAARVSAFGNDYEVEVTCPSCFHKHEYVFDLLDCKKNAGFFDLPEEEREGVEYLGGGIFEFTLPTSGLRVATKISTQSLASRIEKLTAANKAIDFSTLFAEIVVRINDAELSKEQKLQVHDALKLSDIWDFKKKLKKVSPVFSLEQEWKCVNCELEDEMEAPITSRFLFPKL
jgi:hypothetical protein